MWKKVILITLTIVILTGTLFDILTPKINIAGTLLLMIPEVVCMPFRIYKPWLKDAPMSMALYKQITKPNQHNSKDREKELTKVVKQFIPVKTSAKNAFKTCQINNFKTTKISNFNFLDPNSDEEYICSMEDITGRHFWVNTRLKIVINIRNDKVYDLKAYYYLYGL